MSAEAKANTHKLFRLEKKGAGIENLQELSQPIPKPKDHEVLIRVRAASLNFRDHAIAAGAYPFPVKDNFIPLSDGAGEIVEVGSAVTQWKKGDRVVANFDPSHLYGPTKGLASSLGGPLDGMLTQYQTIPATGVLRIPNHLSFEEAAALPCTATTVWNALYGNKPLVPGQVVLLMGTGGVSITALILAKAAGATVIITSSSDEKLKRAKELGADHTINYKTHPNWDEVALQITNGEGVDFVLENGGAPTIERSIKSLKPGGNVSLIGFLAYGSDFVMPNVAMLALGRGVIVRGILVGSVQLFQEALNFIEQRQLRPVIDKVFAFTESDIKAAYATIKSATHLGKLVVRID